MASFPLLAVVKFYTLFQILAVVRANLSVMGFWVPFDQNGGWGYGGVWILGNQEGCTPFFVGVL